MRPKHYPYSGQKKKQPHEEIAELESKIKLLESVIWQHRAEYNYRISKIEPDSVTE